MRKIISILMASAFCVALLAACGGETASSTAPAPEPTPASVSTPASEAVATSEMEEAVASEEVELFSIDFELVNMSGADLVDIRVSPSTETDWGDNLLSGDEVLPDETSVPVSSEVMAVAGTTYDMKTIDSDGDEYEFYDIPLTEITELTMYVEIDEDGNYSNYVEMV